MAIEIRSYRSVFELERRIYRVDRVRLNPSGVPVRGALYFVALLLMALLAAALPLVGMPLRLLPWYMRDLALPLGGAALLTVIRIDGRPFHLAAWSLLGYALRPSRIQCAGAAPLPLTQWRPGALVMLPDGSEARLRRMRCTGPAQARVTVAHERLEWRKRPLGVLAQRERMTVRELPGRRPPRRPQTIALRPGVRLWVR